MIKFLTIHLLLLILPIHLFSQSVITCDFQSPLNIPLSLSSNYGELRVAHFHAGIDFKTQGVTGKPVFAACNGYVSRIKVQRGGYGKALYITHLNGYTTVYVHLDKYVPEIEEFVINSQYSRKSYEIELFPSKDHFIIEKGELIGYSGNTGYSFGPHLHFEIRKTVGQIPVNPLKFNLSVEDNIRPEFISLYSYSYPTEEPVAMGGSERQFFSVIKRNDSTYIVDQIIECLDNYIGFGAEVYDFLNGSSNRCGIYLLQMKVDDIPRFMFQIDAISFANSRYADAHMDFELKTEEGRSVHRLFTLPNNLLPIYSPALENGLLYFADDSVHKCEIIALDAYGNQSSLVFSCKAVRNRSVLFTPTDISTLLSWKKGGSFSIDNFTISIPPKALYQDIYFSAEKIAGDGDLHSDTFKVHKSSEPLGIGITITAKLDSVKNGIDDKLLFARLNGSNKLIAEGGEFRNGILTLTTRNFGNYVIVADTTAPVVKPVSFRSGGKYTRSQSIIFQVEDDLSGIQTYNAFIDNQWALLEYDAKSGMLTYTIDPVRLEEGKLHEIEIVVDDVKNNLCKYNGKFEY